MASDHELEQFFQQVERRFGEVMAGQFIELMVQELGGLRLRVPDLEALQLRTIRRRVKIEFRGTNHQELALRYGRSVSQIRRYLREE